MLETKKTDFKLHKEFQYIMMPDGYIELRMLKHQPFEWEDWNFRGEIYCEIKHVNLPYLILTLKGKARKAPYGEYASAEMLICQVLPDNNLRRAGKLVLLQRDTPGSNYQKTTKKYMEIIRTLIV